MAAPPFEPPPLKQPPVERREATHIWQRQMANRGWMIEADFFYGPKSEQICRNFQREHGLSVDGVVGEKTWKATWDAHSTKPPPAPAQVLKRGSKGSDVRRWQQQVHNRGWNLSVDGSFGTETEKICKEFQGVHGLDQDGIVGPKTWNQAWLETV
jgi:peptidoglycan hydrolase-like protein with peptidoglycan-binding domain